MRPKVLAVILNYGTYELTLKLIAELRNVRYSELDILVVDNCSPNESAQVLRENANNKKYIFIANNSNLGYAAGNNIGIRYAITHGYEYSWILNNDIKIQDVHVLEHMVEIAEKNTDIGCVGPRIYSLEGEICAPYCRRPTIWNMTLGILGEKKFRNSQKYISQKVYRVYGCCMLLKNNIMQEVDCMDERTFLYGEEAILAERMLAVGSTFYYDADVSVIHMESASLRSFGGKQKKLFLRESGKSREIYMRDYRGFNKFERRICNMFMHLMYMVKK